MTSGRDDALQLADEIERRYIAASKEPNDAKMCSALALILTERVEDIVKSLRSARGALSVRPEVRVFAEAMERKLRQNDHKKPWRECSVIYLLDRLKQEVTELEDCFPFNQARTLDEAADIANFAMMVATGPIDAALSSTASKVGP